MGVASRDAVATTSAFLLRWFEESLTRIVPGALCAAQDRVGCDVSARGAENVAPNSRWHAIKLLVAAPSLQRRIIVRRRSAWISCYLSAMKMGLITQRCHGVGRRFRRLERPVGGYHLGYRRGDQKSCFVIHLRCVVVR
jgi:hypothetical protein